MGWIGGRVGGFGLERAVDFGQTLENLECQGKWELKKLLVRKVAFVGAEQAGSDWSTC